PNHRSKLASSRRRRLALRSPLFSGNNQSPPLRHLRLLRNRRSLGPQRPYRPSPLPALRHRRIPQLHPNPLKILRPGTTLAPKPLLAPAPSGVTRTRNCDSLIKGAVVSTASDEGSYDLLTFVTGCSRQRVHLITPVQASFAVLLSQVCLSRL